VILLKQPDASPPAATSKIATIWLWSRSLAALSCRPLLELYDTQRSSAYTASQLDGINTRFRATTSLRGRTRTSRYLLACWIFENHLKPYRDEIDRCRNVTITPSVDRPESAVRPVHNARTNNQPCNSGAVAKPRSLLTSTTSSNISDLENFEGAEWQRRIHLQTQCLVLNVPTMAQS
jgi:hypothetical protein